MNIPNAIVDVVSSLDQLVIRAARALPDVYGAPPGTQRVASAVRRAKELHRHGMEPAQAIRKAAKEYVASVRAIAESVLAMPGAAEDEA